MPPLEIKGHEEIQNRLVSALKEQNLPQALLFSGPSGIGKRKTARRLAQCLLCDAPSPPCGICPSCRKVERGESEMILQIAPRTLQITKDEVRGARSFLALGTSARAKIVIVDEADLLNLPAVNSLLKIVEEPPRKSFFFFISSSPGRLPVTLRSRLQNIRFKPLPEEVLRSLVSEEEGREWALTAARGRLDLIEQLRGKKDLRDLSLKLWKDLLRPDTFPFAVSFPVELKDRKQALFVSQSWQWLLRDGRMRRAGAQEGFIHGDQIPLIEHTARLPSGALDFLIERCLLLERDLRAYGDCILCLEQFALILRNCAGRKSGAATEKPNSL